MAGISLVLAAADQIYRVRDLRQWQRQHRDLTRTAVKLRPGLRKNRAKVGMFEDRDDPGETWQREDDVSRCPAPSQRIVQHRGPYNAGVNPRKRQFKEQFQR